VSTNGRLTALDLSGNFLWETDSGLFGGSGVRLRVSAAGNIVYGGGFAGQIGGFDTGSGTLLWQSYVGGEIFAPAIAIGQIFGQTSANQVYAMNATTGALNWSYDTTGGVPMEGSSSNFPPTYVNGTVIVSTGHISSSGASLGNSVLGIDARSGKLLWSADLGLERATQPTDSNGMVTL
jgi:outer membrane protein assembly factor BamB